jgi:hypothetical protein
VTGITQKIVAPAERKAFAHGGDAAQLRRARFVTALLQRLRQSYPAGCGVVWNGGDWTADMQLTPTEETEFLATVSDLMRSAAARPTAGDGRQPDPLMLQVVYGPALHSYGNVVLDTRTALRSGRISDREVCDIAVTTFSKVAMLAPAGAGEFLRWISSLH